MCLPDLDGGVGESEERDSSCFSEVYYTFLFELVCDLVCSCRFKVLEQGERVQEKGKQRSSSRASQESDREDGKEDKEEDCGVVMGGAVGVFVDWVGCLGTFWLY